MKTRPKFKLDFHSISNMIVNCKEWKWTFERTTERLIAFLNVHFLHLWMAKVVIWNFYNFKSINNIDIVLVKPIKVNLFMLIHFYFMNKFYLFLTKIIKIFIFNFIFHPKFILCDHWFLYSFSAFSLFTQVFMLRIKFLYTFSCKLEWTFIKLSHEIKLSQKFSLSEQYLPHS